MATEGQVRAQLSALEQVDDAELQEHFYDNMEAIAVCEQPDIVDILEGKDGAILNEIRNSLIELVRKMFKEYAKKVPIKRTSTRNLCQDIYCLSVSLVHKTPDASLPKVFKPSSSGNTQSVPAAEPGQIPTVGEGIMATQDALPAQGTTLPNNQLTGTTLLMSGDEDSEETGDTAIQDLRLSTANDIRIVLFRIIYDMEDLRKKYEKVKDENAKLKLQVNKVELDVEVVKNKTTNTVQQPREGQGTSGHTVTTATASLDMASTAATAAATEDVRPSPAAGQAQAQPPHTVAPAPAPVHGNVAPAAAATQGNNGATAAQGSARSLPANGTVAPAAGLG